jgi:hypothetical protein
MAKSPCIGCEFELVDKNNPTCRECDKRVEYVALVGEEMNIERPIRQRALADRIKKIEIEETAGACIEKRKYHKTTINNQQSKECLIKGCGEEVYCRGLCRNRYQQWYTGYIDHPVLGKYKVAQPKKNSIREDKRGQVMGRDKTGSQSSTQSFAEPGRAEGTKNKLIDLNNHMFAQLERLSDVKLKGDKLTEEIQRSHAVTSVASQIISNAGLALKAQMAVNELLLKNPPKMLGVPGFDENK